MDGNDRIASVRRARLTLFRFVVRIAFLIGFCLTFGIFTPIARTHNAPDSDFRLLPLAVSSTTSFLTALPFAREAFALGSADGKSWLLPAESPAAGDGLGWIELPNTHLQDVCPSNTTAYEFRNYCHGIVAAWSGGIADTARNRLIIWGGGHNDYYGNEIYALDLNTNKLTRLNDPSPVNGDPPQSPRCVEALADGAPNSRHTYGGLAYIAHADRMFVFSGSLACAGGGVGDDTWTLDLATLQWHRMDPTGNKNAHPNPLYFDAMADYDPVTKLVYVDDRGNALWSYSYEGNTYTRLADTPGLGLGSNAVIDPKRRQFLIFGPDSKDKPSLHSIKIGGGHYAMSDLTARAVGCDALMGKDADYPGLAYDTVLDRIVGWVNANDTNAVYLYDPDTYTCTARRFPGGPVVRPEVRGVLGRWRYFPRKGVFAVVSDPRQNAFLLRLMNSEGALATQVIPAVSPVARNSDSSASPAAGPSPNSDPRPASGGNKPSSPLSADEDFAARCAMPGVVRCYSFDDPADAVKYIRPGALTGENRTRVVSDMKASGSGSLRFTIPPHSDDGSSGSFSINFSSDLSFQVGEGQEFYVQWRQRFSSDLLKTVFTNSEGFKQAIISDGDRPGHVANACTQLEIVLQNTSQRGIPQLYHSCGEKDGAYEPLSVYDSRRAPGKYEIQNGLNPPCLWMEVKSPPCVMYRPDQWMTFQIHVKVGTWYKNDRKYHGDSIVQLWVADEGQPSKLVIDFSPKSDSHGYDLANEDPINKYGKIWLLPYQTHKDPTQVHPICYTWYDELIISRTKIPDPGTGHSVHTR